MESFAKNLFKLTLKEILGCKRSKDSSVLFGSINLHKETYFVSSMNDTEGIYEGENI